jgi:hypothetical protein
MRHPHGPIKQSGDVHPPELDDGFDELDETGFDAAQPAAMTAAPTARTQPSLMPLLGLLGGLFVLYRLIR